MALSTGIIGGAGLALSAIGTATQVVGAKMAATASAASEKLREKQMNLEAMRSKRQTIREAIMARSTALSNATAQGAGEGSGLQGGYGQISGQMGRNLQATEQSREIGTGIFRANAQEARAQGIAATGSGISGFGGMVLQNQPAITRLGRYFTRNPSL